MSNWRVVPGATRYLVSVLGHVRRIGVYRDLAESPNRSGYLRVKLPHDDGVRRWRFCHLICLEAFRGARPEGRFGTHANGDQLDNSLGNLAWRTFEENESDKDLHGTKGTHKLYPSDVRSVRAWDHHGVPWHIIARKHHLSYSQVRRILDYEAYVGAEAADADAAAE